MLSFGDKNKLTIRGIPINSEGQEVEVFNIVVVVIAIVNI